LYYGSRRQGDTVQPMVRTLAFPRLRLVRLTAACAAVAVNFAAAANGAKTPPAPLEEPSRVPVAAPPPPTPPAEAQPISPPVGYPSATTQQCVATHAAGQEARLERRLRDALGSFDVCSRPSCPELVRADCMLWRAEVAGSLPLVSFKLPDHIDAHHVRVFVNDAPVNVAFDEPMSFDPGRVRFRLEAPGHLPHEEVVTLELGQPVRVVEVSFRSERPLTQAAPLSTPPLPAPPPKPLRHPVPVLSYVLGGAAIAAAGVSTYFVVTAIEQRADVRARCAPLCTAPDVEPINRKLLVADIAAGTSLVSAAIAVALYFTQDDPSNTARFAPVRVNVAEADFEVVVEGLF
jgi:hypothetical protein